MFVFGHYWVGEGKEGRKEKDDYKIPQLPYVVFCLRERVCQGSFDNIIRYQFLH